MAVNQELHRLLYAAIENQRLIGFKYKGEDRVAEPHDYGIQNRVVRLLCWQVGGKSGGRIPGLATVRCREYGRLRDAESSLRGQPTGFVGPTSAMG
jgi:hypothetical protein